MIGTSETLGNRAVGKAQMLSYMKCSTREELP
jgi:hypothetical protein